MESKTEQIVLIYSFWHYTFNLELYSMDDIKDAKKVHVTQVVCAEPKVVMDRCLKHFQKSSLLARRRNYTASKMLEEELKYLEEKYFRGYRKHLNERSRIRSALRQIEHVASEPGKDVSKTQLQTRPGNSVLNQDVLSYKNQSNIVPKMQDEGTRSDCVPASLINRLPQFNIRPAPSLLSAGCTEGVTHYGKANEPSYKSSVVHSNQMDSNNLYVMTAKTTGPSAGNNLSNNACETQLNFVGNASIPSKSKKLQKNEFKEKKEDFSAQSSYAPHGNNLFYSPVVCKYCSQYQSNVLCNHFPCVATATYHSISQSEKAASSRPTKQIEAQSKVDALSENAINNREINLNDKRVINDGIQIPNHKRAIPTSRKLNRHNQDPKPTNGSLYKPKSSDPILGRVRRELKEPPATVSATPRNSVQENIRRLRQLTLEMRVKKEHQKPQEWAVNYGQHFPQKVLLKPVLP